jgi:hypothetical protein
MMNAYQALSQVSLAFLPNNEMIWSLVQKVSQGVSSAKIYLLGLFNRKIDTNPDPFTPEGLGVSLHVGHGNIVWDMKNIKPLRISDGQLSESGITGHQLLEEIKLVGVMNASVLDWLVNNKYYIPQKWQGKKIFFWGTLYETPGGNLFVRYLDCTGEEVSWTVLGLDKKLDANSYVLLV